MVVKPLGELQCTVTPHLRGVPVLGVHREHGVSRLGHGQGSTGWELLEDGHGLTGRLLRLRDLAVTAEVRRHRAQRIRLPDAVAGLAITLQRLAP